MTFRFSRKHYQEYNLKDLGKDDFLILAIEAAGNLEWNISIYSDSGFVAYTKSSLSSWSEQVIVKIENGVVSLKSECTGNQLIDWGKNKKNIEAFLSRIEIERSVLTPENIEFKLVELRQKYTLEEIDTLNKSPLSTSEKITSFFSVFKPTEGYFISPILININLLVFIVMIISGVHFMLPESQDLINWGANFRPLTQDGQWWRLFTACFLHIGILHLLLNMYALLYIGLLLEPYIGKTRFLSAYLITGLAASMTSLWWNDFTISAGASGAIFGMYGVFIALLTTNLIEKTAKNALMTSIAVFVGYNILNGLEPDSGIDNAAHIGGLISGLITGYAFSPGLKPDSTPIIKYSTIGALTIALLLSITIVSKSLPNDLVQYEERMQRFMTLESMALEVYNLPSGTPPEMVLTELKSRGIYYWNENLNLIESCRDLALPLPLQMRNNKLKEYCELRIKSYELIYKSIAEDTIRYEKEITGYNQRIEAIIKELTGNP